MATIRIQVDPTLVASRALFERTRRRVGREDVRRFAPNDPGYPDYVAAFHDILDRGEAALSLDFAVTETIGLTRWCTAPSAEYRWLRLLTSAVALVGGDLIWDACPLNYTLAALLVDTFALHDAKDRDAPTDLLLDVCRELGEAQTTAPQELVFSVLAAILTSCVAPLDDASIQALCASLERSHERFHAWYVPGTNWEQNHHFVEDERFVWGLTRFDQLHSVWLDMVVERFPEAPVQALKTKERLLRDGRAWSTLERALG